MAAAAILVTVAVVAPRGNPGTAASWSEAARPVITALTNDIAAAHQDLVTQGVVAPVVRASLVKDLGQARRIGQPAVTSVSADWSDALNQLSAALRASATESSLLRARQDLLAVGQVVGL